jgi:uncharacterized protein (DUF302 family)
MSGKSFSDAVAGAEQALAEAAVPLIARIDHSLSASEAELTLRPTLLLLFGSARGGTPMMEALPTSAIDLPMKLLIWQDHDGRVWLAANDPVWIARRHGSGTPADLLTASLKALIAKVMAAAA